MSSLCFATAVRDGRRGLSNHRGLSPAVETRSQIRADRDWFRFAASRRGTATLLSWAARCPHLGAHSCLDDVVIAMRSEPRERSNRYWCELLGLGRDGDEVARRLMLQVVVPFLERETTRWHTVFVQAHQSRTRAEVEQFVYVAAVQALRHLESREGVAWPVLDVVRMTRASVKATVRADERWNEATTTFDDNADPETLHGVVGDGPLVVGEDDQVRPAAELGRVLNELVASGRVTASTAALVWQTRCGLASFDELAGELATPAATLRRRRHRAEEALQGAMADAA